MKKLIRTVLFIGVILILGYVYHDEIKEFANEKLGEKTTQEVAFKVKDGTDELIDLIESTVEKVAEQNKVAKQNKVEE